MATAGLASLFSRNLVPLAGVLLFGWSAPNLLMLYSVDTSLALGGVLMLAAVHMSTPESAGPRLLSGLVAWLRALLGVFFFGAFFAIAISIPLYVVLAPFGWSLTEQLDDRTFAGALLLQAVLSAADFVRAYHELNGRPDLQKLLQQRTGFMLGRWVAMIGIAFLLFTVLRLFLSGETGLRVVGFAVLLVYVGTTLYFELFPDRMRTWLNLRR